MDPNLMGKKVTKYQANDGTLFDTDAEANHHDRMSVAVRTLQDAIAALLIYGKVDGTTLFEVLTDEDSTLTGAVKDYHAAK